MNPKDTSISSGKKDNKKTKNKGISSNNKESIVTDVTDVTDVTSVTDLPVTSVTLLQEYLETILGDSIFDRILKFLAENKKYFTDEEIAKNIGEKKGSIRQAINRKKDHFLFKSCNSKKRLSQLSQIAVDNLVTDIQEIKQIQADQEQRKKDLQAKEAKEKEHIIEIKNYLRENKPKRDNMFLIIDFADVVTYSPELADILLEQPEKFIEQIQMTYSNRFTTKFINIPSVHEYNIEDIRKDHLNNMLVIEGRVTSLGEVRPVITKAVYSCPSCGTLISVHQNYRIPVLREPTRCSCGRRGGFHLEEREEKNACFIQIEDLQDKTDNPHSRRLKAILFDSLCEPNMIKQFTPGNEVKVTGVLKEVPVFKGQSQSLFLNWIFEINDVELIEKDIDVQSFSEEEVSEIKEVAKKIDTEGISYLNNSFAPEVYGYEEIKQALMLQLSNRRNECKNKSIRNKSNILLIGDPGIAKTVLCKYAVKASTGAREAVGGGSSAVGITASVVKEEDSMGGYRVEPGAMILAKDLLFLDELNNLAEEDKPKLQEGMSEQRVSINKANLHVQMKVTCGILAVANPIYGHFKTDAKESLAEQFNIPTPILNRFDTIFMMRDEVNGDNDKKIAERMMKRHTGKLEPEHSLECLKKYFAYVRHSEEPEIEQDIIELMKDIYSSARKSHGNVKINPRFFESLTRMSSASAKMRLSNKVEKKDIGVALKILAKSQYGINELIVQEVNPK